MAGEPPFPPALSPTAAEVADWVEYVALSRSTSFKRGDLKSAVHLEGLSAPDVIEEEVWDLLGRRSELLGSQWPLRAVGSRIRRRSPAPVSLPLYRFLCLLGFASSEDKERRLFEVLVSVLVRQITSGPSLHLGAPASSGMDPSFRRRVERYVEDSGILKYEVKVAPLPDDKDLGLDVATWFPFADRRGVSLHYVVQCATGSDWEGKLSDLNLDVWSDHLHWGVTPVRVFAVPFLLLLPEAKWVRLARRGGLILDRLRLTELARRAELPRDLLRQLRSSVRKLSDA